MREIVLNGVNTAVRLERYPDALPSETQVQAFELAMGFQLPEDYRAFLLTYNGGICEFERVLVPIDGYICDLFGFYPSGPDSRMLPLRLPNSPELLALWGEMPPNVLPIGEVDSGDMIALRFLPGGSEVVVLDHESGALKVEMRENTFTELLTNTRPPEYDED